MFHSQTKLQTDEIPCRKHLDLMVQIMVSPRFSREFRGFPWIFPWIPWFSPDFPIHFPIPTARPWGIACPEHPRRRGGASSGALPGDPLAGATQPGAGTWRVLVYHGTVDLYGNSWGYNGKCGNSQEFPGDEWGFSWGKQRQKMIVAPNGATKLLMFSTIPFGA